MPACVRSSRRAARIDIYGGEVLPGIRFIATPGYSINQVAVEIVSEGRVALFGDDDLRLLLGIIDLTLS